MISKFILAFMAFFAIMNPISNLPAFMALVADDDQEEFHVGLQQKEYYLLLSLL